MNNTNLFTRLAHHATMRTFLARNPVIEACADGKLSATQIAEIIRQYVRLPEEIAEILTTAAEWFPENHPIRKELARNVAQERGADTGGIAHVDLLKDLLERELQMDARHPRGRVGTERFLSALKEGMRRNPWFALGQAYALEWTAIPELANLVGPLLNAYADLTKAARPYSPCRAEDLPSSLPTAEDARRITIKQWLGFHICEFEVGHRDFLQEAAKPELVSAEHRRDFVEGFTYVLQLMDAWWASLAEIRA